MPANANQTPAPHDQQEVTQVPLQIVGGTKFGRYSKISSEATWNMIVSDGWLVPYAGWASALDLNSSASGRGAFSSYVGNLMVVVLGTAVYSVLAQNSTSTPLVATLVGSLYTESGDVYIAENNNAEICITDGLYVYVYNWSTGVFVSSNPSTTDCFPFGDPTAPFTNPGYISFQNGYLIIACSSSTNWVLSGINNATTWGYTSQTVGAIQTKPDFCQAVVPVPGGGNNALVFGRNVTELWQFTAAALFPYQRQSTSNIDYGCLNPATIAHLTDYVVWLAVNEQSGPVIMVAHSGAQIEQISTDGIDYQLGNLTDPTNCTGFLFQQDGHIIYQFTFPTDNISYAYDFNTKMFFNVSDENLDYHPAREVVYFNNTYYFVALSLGNVYQFDTIITTANYSLADSSTVYIIPRQRVCPSLRLPDQRYYIANSLGFTIEQGQADSGNVSLSISRNGGESYGSSYTLQMNNTGYFLNRFIFQRLGIANDATFLIRFNAYGRIVVTDGLIELQR